MIPLNEPRKRGSANRVAAACGGGSRVRPSGLLGRAFRPNADDWRDAPSLAIALALDDMGTEIRAAFCEDA